MIDHGNDIALRAACRTNDTQEALRLLGDGADPLFNAGSAVLWSARHENLDLLDALYSTWMYCTQGNRRD